jgi:hypothetical protein
VFMIAAWTNITRDGTRLGCQTAHARSLDVMALLDTPSAAAPVDSWVKQQVASR